MIDPENPNLLRISDDPQEIVQIVLDSYRGVEEWQGTAVPFC